MSLIIEVDQGNAVSGPASGQESKQALAGKLEPADIGHRVGIVDGVGERANAAAKIELEVAALCVGVVAHRPGRIHEDDEVTGALFDALNTHH